jgi:hypothetical protein
MVEDMVDKFHIRGNALKNLLQLFLKNEELTG